MRIRLLQDTHYKCILNADRVLSASMISVHNNGIRFEFLFVPRSRLNLAGVLCSTHPPPSGIYMCAGICLVLLHKSHRLYTIVLARLLSRLEY